MKGRIKYLGEILVIFRKVHILTAQEHATAKDRVPIGALDSIPEKALKGRALSHQVR
jgi:hypothetical protein